MHIERVSPALGARVSGLDIEYAGEAECSALSVAPARHVMHRIAQRGETPLPVPTR